MAEGRGGIPNHVGGKNWEIEGKKFRSKKKREKGESP